ncbi:MAG: hypothetical protein H0W92_05655, partial [Sphingomonas sp.]|nr:hypothetical protein [Sphingomonas sp.]
MDAGPSCARCPKTWKDLPLLRFALFASTALLTACATTSPEPLIAPPAAEAMVAPEAVPVAAPAQKSAELATFFNDYDKAELELSPLS